MPIPLRPTQPEPDELTLLRAFEAEVRARYDEGGHITRDEVAAALSRLDAARK